MVGGHWHLRHVVPRYHKLSFANTPNAYKSPRPHPLQFIEFRCPGIWHLSERKQAWHRSHVRLLSRKNKKDGQLPGFVRPRANIDRHRMMMRWIRWCSNQWKAQHLNKKPVGTVKVRIQILDRRQQTARYYATKGQKPTQQIKSSQRATDAIIHSLKCGFFYIKEHALDFRWSGRCFTRPFTAMYM